MDSGNAIIIALIAIIIVVAGVLFFMNGHGIASNDQNQIANSTVQTNGSAVSNDAPSTSAPTQSSTTLQVIAVAPHQLQQILLAQTIIQVHPAMSQQVMPPAQLIVKQVLPSQPLKRDRLKEPMTQQISIRTNF